MSYQPQKIEPKWQKFWAKNNYKTWQTKDKAKKKIYILDMFPYPSGEGLHVGHIEGYTASDILARYYRHQGFNVLHPMGWDAFGLPAENYAILKKMNPQQCVAKNISRFRKQLKEMGFSYDWQKEINTTDSQYYKWTQWIFLKLYEKGLAYEEEIPVNWCPSCCTVLADEEVVDGLCERCKSQTERKKMRQWVLKITAYADRLLKDLDLLNWPSRVKTMQKNWIGRSEGHEIEFKVVDSEERIKVFTTRIDTIFGVSYLLLSPEHPMVLKITTENRMLEVKKYIDQASQKTDFERNALAKDKTGVFLGAHVINPANQERIPVWVSDYVLMQYGNGAVMGVPAHDERDFEFAKNYSLPIIEVISKNGIAQEEITNPSCEEGILINSGPFNNIQSEIAREKIALYTGAKSKVCYKLRDWIFSRQRYWGEPIPIIKCSSCGNIPLKENQLPLKLPMVKNYQPTGTGESPLANIDSWVKVKCPKCFKEARRETNTMPQWAGSCWYYLRYLDPKNKKKLVDLKKEKYWQPVDIYIGGVEHAVLHLLYARFWHKFLYDLGVVSTKEPFASLVNQGIILGEDGEKMSKSKGNVVNPDEIIKKYGADSLRMYEMFMGPLIQSKPWDSQGIVGIYRFLVRIWNLYQNLLKPFNKEISKKIIDKKGLVELKKNIIQKNNALEILRHKTIQKVTEDIEKMRFNTAISSLMIYLNHFEEIINLEIEIQKIEKTNLSLKKKYFNHWRDFALMLSPFAPHLTEELWQNILKEKSSISFIKWPKYEEAKTIDKNFMLLVEINGKIKTKINASKGITQNIAESLAFSHPQIKKILVKKPKKIIFVKDKLINFVI